MTPANTMRGFSLGFSTLSQTLTTCSRLLFLPTCIDTPVEQFCASYSGPCLEKTLDASGEPIAGQFEPAICVYSKSLFLGKRPMSRPRLHQRPWVSAF